MCASPVSQEALQLNVIGSGKFSVMSMGKLHSAISHKSNSDFALGDSRPIRFGY